jgi:aspartyl-tRNA(Asn)/glutamyl-tRNA(Gln) amidotransferase subunit B
VNAQNLGQLLSLLNDGTISGRLAKDVFAIMVETGQDPARIVEERGLKQVTDTSSIEPVVMKIIEENPGQVETYRKNPKVIGWFVGQVMKATGGKANPAVVQELVRTKLDG